jgi:hypothetical protein
MATINDAVRLMYLNQTGREADPGGLEYFANRFGADSKIDEDELAIFRQMAPAEVAGQEARRAAAAAQQAAVVNQLTSQLTAAGMSPANFYASGGQLPVTATTGTTAGTATTNQGNNGAQLAALAANAASNAGATTAATGMTIEQAYQQVLGRTPSASEIAYWKTQFGNSVDATELSTFSVAAQPERAAAPTTYPKIREMYLSVLGREPDASGLEYFYKKFGDTVESNELDIFKEMTIQEQTANAARNAGTTAGTTAGTVQPIVRPTGPRQVTGTQLAPASFAQTAITGTPYTNLYTPSNVQQNAPRLSDIQAATQSANPYQSLMALTPQRTLSPSYAAQAGQTTANTNLGGYDTSLYNQPLTGLLAPSTVTGGGGNDLVNNSGDQRGPGTTNTASNINPLAVGMARVANLFSSPISLTRAPVTDAVFNPVGGGSDTTGFEGRTAGGDFGGDAYGGSYNFAKGGKVNMAPQMNNPPGPDDGYAALDNGEYVIRKSAVKKYGANIFEKINAGQIPAKRLKSLLE